MWWQIYQWFTGNILHWIAPIGAVVAAVIGWRIWRSRTYIEFYPDWSVNIKDKDVTVKGKVKTISPAAFIGGNGILKVNGQKIKLHFKESSAHMLYANTQTLTFAGEYKEQEKLPSSIPSTLKIQVKLSDGTTKGFQKQLNLESVATD